MRTLTLTSESIAPSGWVQAELGASGRADVGGGLRVTGNLVVDGTIQGDIAAGTVQPGDLVDNAVTSAKIAEADGASGQDTNTGSGVKTGHIQDGAVTNAKIGADLDGRIKTVETHAAITAGNPHNTTAKDIDGANNQIVAQINAGPASSTRLGSPSPRN